MRFGSEAEGAELLMSVVDFTALRSPPVVPAALKRGLELPGSVLSMPSPSNRRSSAGRFYAALTRKSVKDPVPFRAIQGPVLKRVTRVPHLRPSAPEEPGPTRVPSARGFFREEGTTGPFRGELRRSVARLLGSRISVYARRYGHAEA